MERGIPSRINTMNAGLAKDRIQTQQGLNNQP